MELMYHCTIKSSKDKHVRENDRKWSHEFAKCHYSMYSRVFLFYQLLIYIDQKRYEMHIEVPVANEFKYKM